MNKYEHEEVDRRRKCEIKMELQKFDGKSLRRKI
jgi:hypothetical protein